MLKTCCPNPACDLVGQHGSGNVIRYRFFSIGHEYRRRNHCIACGKTFVIDFRAYSDRSER